MKNISNRHGLSEHSIYKRLCTIKSRCYNKNNKDYKYYGGRGIKVCDEWRYDFKAFYDYVTSLPGYDLELTIDRKDNNGNYEPGNLRWANMHTQTANRRMLSINKSGYTGVFKSGKFWRSHITVNRQLIYLGWFHNILDCVAERDQYIIDNNLIGYPLQSRHEKNINSTRYN